MAGAAPTPVETANRPTVLIVDDEPMNLQVLGEILSRHYRVQAAPSGQEALRLVARQPPPDLVLLDVMMPQLDGFQVLERMKADPATRDIPVIFVTALSEDSDEEKGFRLGAVDYIHKPIRALVVLSRVRTHLEAVAARAALKRANLRLEDKVTEGAHALEQAQQALVHSERLAAMGQLAAGIVHEINNPMAFVDSNLDILGDYVDELLEVISAHEQADAAAGRDPEGPKAAKKKVDFEMLKEDAPLAVSETREGVRRVRQIVRDLKDFSRAGGGDWEWADLHKGLDSTLTIATGELKRKCTVSKRYGTLPMVRCLPSQLNQVFMNLLVNAAQAMETRGEITITTRALSPDRVQVAISDNGRGMPPEVKKRLFEPFFTTKPAGQGTGLGLSLSRGIIERHGGTIEVESEPGKGTTFTISLPVEHTPTPAPAGA